jgi:hypothetical protein
MVTPRDITKLKAPWSHIFVTGFFMKQSLKKYFRRLVMNFEKRFGEVFFVRTDRVMTSNFLIKNIIMKGKSSICWPNKISTKLLFFNKKDSIFRVRRLMYKLNNTPDFLQHLNKKTYYYFNKHKLEDLKRTKFISFQKNKKSVLK